MNSGSSANLIALSCLTSFKLPKERRIKPGDEVITVAAGFPTTVAPIIQVGAVPVFIDASSSTGNPDTSLLEQAYSPGLTKAVIFAHALGNPFNITEVLKFCKNIISISSKIIVMLWDHITRCQNLWVILLDSRTLAQALI